ncbi:MAG TPA: hypothetical protein GXX25_06480 [Desulfotomaculum sp.]|nr:hypothetical protein [Desulfotomaculum sp.]
MADYTFATITGRVVFDYGRCRQCREKPCVASCSAGVLKLEGDVPVLAMDAEQVRKGKCTECLACELECHFRGAGGLHIDLPIPGLEAVAEVKRHVHLN